MRRLCIICLLAAILPCSAWAQKVEVQKPKQGRILHIHTALNHLTVLEMNAPVSTVAVGSQVFRVEWRANKVFIEPTEPNVATDLFVWTPVGRFNYELDPPGAVPQMDFAVDQPPVPPPKPAARAERDPNEQPVPALLMGSLPLRTEGTFSGKNRVIVLLTGLFEHNGKLLICYRVRNGTKAAYAPGMPQAVVLNAPRYYESLYVLRDTELSPHDAAHLKSNGDTPIRITSATMSSPRIGPGQQATGIVTVGLPKPNGTPTVLRLVFPSAWTGPVTATLVL
jgi:hypothetical protein